MKTKSILGRLGMVVLAATTVTACDLDLTNPNSPTEEQVVSNIDGVVALAVGMQGQFCSGQP